MFKFFIKTFDHQAADEVLMQGIKSGHEAAFNALYDRYHRKLFRYLLRLMNQNRAYAEDLLQDLFMKVIDAAHSYDDTQKVSTWLYTIATNMCRSQWRKTKNQERLITQFNSWEHQESSTVADQIDGKILAHEIHEILDRMEEADREIIVLRFHEELTIREIAVILNIPEGTVKSRIFYLLRKLSVKLKNYQTS